MDKTEKTKMCTRSIKWTTLMIEKLCFGVVRRYMNVAVHDIGSIIFIYLQNMLIDMHINHIHATKIDYFNDSTMVCRFHKNDKFILNSQKCKRNRYSSMIIFTPYIIKDLFGSQFCTDTLFTTNNKSNNISNNNVHSVVTKSMDVELLENDCNGCNEMSWQCSCGIIGVPRRLGLSLNDLKDKFECEVDKELHCNYEWVSIMKNKDNIDLTNMTNFCYPFNKCISYYLWKEQNPFFTDKEYFFGFNKDVMKLRLHKDNNESFKVRVCIERVIKKLSCVSSQDYYLYFKYPCTNDEKLKIAGNEIHNNEVMYGKIKLSSEFDYCFAVDSTCCSCPSKQGIKFQVSINSGNHR